MGRIDTEKGIVGLVDAFAQRESIRRTGARLSVAGDGRQLPALREKFGHGSVDFLGQCPPADFLGAIDVLLVPSVWDEPFGRIVAEAALCGVPTVTFAHGGPAAQVREHGCGVVVAGDIHDLLDAADALAASPTAFADAQVGCSNYAKWMKAHSPASVYLHTIEDLGVLSGASRAHRG